MTRKGWAQQGSAASRGYGAEWQRLRKLALARDAGLCQCRHCKASGVIRFATEVDHIVPKAKGGTDDTSNLQAINAECHKRKTAEDEGKAHRHATGADGWPVA